MPVMTSQTDATEIAAERGYKVEVHRITTGDCWDVRLYWTGSDYNPHNYNRRRDVVEARISEVVMAMLSEMAPESD